MATPPDLAHIHHAELLSTTPEESLRFFVDILGMRSRRGRPSAYLRGWGDYGRYSLKLTESARTGIGHLAFRAWNQEALDRVARAVEAAGRGQGWSAGDHGHGPAYRFTDPDGHVFEILYEADRYDAPPELAPSLKNQPQRYTGRGVAVKRLDHVNLLAADVRGAREFATDVLGYRLYERVELDDGPRRALDESLDHGARAHLHPRPLRRRRPAAPSRSGSTRARNACARPTSSSTTTSTSRAAPSKHTIAQGFFLYAYEPPGTGSRSRRAAGVYDPDEPTVVGRRPSAKGQAWGVKTIEAFHTYGRRPSSAEGVRPESSRRGAWRSVDDPRLDAQLEQEASRPPSRRPPRGVPVAPSSSRSRRGRPITAATCSSSHSACPAAAAAVWLDRGRGGESFMKTERRSLSPRRPPAVADTTSTGMPRARSVRRTYRRSRRTRARVSCRPRAGTGPSSATSAKPRARRAPQATFERGRPC